MRASAVRWAGETWLEGSWGGGWDWGCGYVGGEVVGAGGKLSVGWGAVKGDGACVDIAWLRFLFQLRWRGRRFHCKAINVESRL